MTLLARAGQTDVYVVMLMTMMAMLLPKSWPTVQSLDVRTIMMLLAVLGQTDTRNNCCETAKDDYEAVGRAWSN